MRPIASISGFAAALAAAFWLTMPAAMSGEAAKPAANAQLAEAIFAAGCFWCVESDFDKLDGVAETISGYTGGKTANPTYEEVGSGTTGHTEALLVRYDPKKVSYQKLLHHYWRNVDLLDGTGQFCDRGPQYRPAIFTTSPEQAAAAAASKAELKTSGRFDKPIAVEILPATPFTAAEDYHQNYYITNPLKYKYYRTGCGRDARLNQLWGSEAAH